MVKSNAPWKILRFFRKIKGKFKMGRLMFYIFLLFFSCNSQNSSKNEVNENAFLDSISSIQKDDRFELGNINDSSVSTYISVGILDSVGAEVPNVIKDRVYIGFREKVKANQVELESEADTVLIFEKESLFKAALGWKVFLLEGFCISSEAAIHVYGVFNDNINAFYFEEYILPVGIVTKLETFKASHYNIEVFGQQWDLAGLDQKNSEIQMLIHYTQ